MVAEREAARRPGTGSGLQTDSSAPPSTFSRPGSTCLARPMPPSVPGVGRRRARWADAPGLAGRRPKREIEAGTIGWLAGVERRARIGLDREAMTEDLCEHDMVPAFCALCRPLPVGVLARGFRTKGGDAYHNDDRCDWLRKGQRFAERKGMEVHPIEPVAWHSVSPGQLAPCEACCTPEWIERHQRAGVKTAGVRPRSQASHQRFLDRGQGEVERTAEPSLSSRAHVQPVWVNLHKLFGSSASSSVPDGLVLEVVHGGLSRWTRSADGGWIGIVTWIGRTTAGSSVKASDQWVPADALRPRY